MSTRTERDGSRLRTWVTAPRVVWVGTVVVVLLLTLPIHILGPGDHEQKSCGNALSMDLDYWTGPSDGNYWEKAYRTCNSKRTDRLGQALGVVSLTVLAATLLGAGTRRRSVKES
ncbi:hypothetical protein [Micromonospora sp. U21]|uniref:hypothetical protein n=1 Tax=Micromonospora sp. U21 TaxID=2824899 RepID=UPI001B35D50F|nr:hypothetical protein [Micromonospora sp. U21]MBQ0904330.1 hypothetical protein [Micromonospora sp. U21]